MRITALLASLPCWCCCCGAATCAGGGCSTLVDGAANGITVVSGAGIKAGGAGLRPVGAPCVYTVLPA